MKICDIIEKLNLTVFAEGNKDAFADGVFCCDVPSLALSKLEKDKIWVSVIGNVNSVAVAYRCECPCIVLAHSVQPVDEIAVTEAKAHGIWLLGCDESIFDTALNIHKAINSEN